MGLERHGLRWVHPEACAAHPFDDGRAAALFRDPGRTAATLDALHPGDGAAWLAFAGPWLRRFGALRRTMLSGFPPLRGPAELVARRRPGHGARARPPAAHARPGPGPRALRGRALAGVALRRGDARRRPAARRGQRDRRRVPRPPRPRRRLAEPGGRRRAAGRGARRAPAGARRRGAQRGARHARRGGARPRHRGRAPPTATGSARRSSWPTRAPRRCWRWPATPSAAPTRPRCAASAPGPRR